MILPLLLSLLAGACGQIEFEMSVDAAVNETVFMERVEALSRKGRENAINTTNNTTNATLPLVVISRARFNVTKTVSILCIDGVGCFNDLPSLPSSATEAYSVVGLVCGVLAASLFVVGILVYASCRPRPAQKAIRIQMAVRNRGWAVG